MFTEMSKSGLFAHFRSKESLQVEVLQRARERFIDVVMRPALAAPRGVARVRALFDGWMRWQAGADAGCIFVAASAEFDDQPGLVRDELVRSEQDWLDTMATVAGTAVAEGEFREQLDIEQFAYEMHGIMLAHHHASRLLRSPRSDERARRALDALITRSTIAA